MGGTLIRRRETDQQISIHRNPKSRGVGSGGGIGHRYSATMPFLKKIGTPIARLLSKDGKGRNRS
jgi:hypothetical protein